MSLAFDTLRMTAACGLGQFRQPAAPHPGSAHGQHPHTVENAWGGPRRLGRRQEDARTLKERCERAFAYCDNREHRADAEALEVWCGAVGVTLDSTLAAKARIAPLLEAATLRILRGQPRKDVCPMN